MEYVLSMTFLTTGGKKSTLSISGVKNNLTKDQVLSLMDTIIEKNVFQSDSGNYVSKDNARLTERKITKFELN